jgi:AraC family transcriptional regulator of adaptative response / DNA-3-methyladenine glycosylase II
LRVERGARDGRLRAEISHALVPVLPQLVVRLRRLFDLDAQPHAIEAVLAGHPKLAQSLARTPGLRVPGAFEGHELLFRAILGQQVSVAAATTLAGRLARAFGEPLGDGALANSEPGLELLTPTPARIASASVEQLAALGLPGARANALRAAAQACASGKLRLQPLRQAGVLRATCDALLELPGIGPWTASYIAMRALGDPDALPEGDLVLCKALGLRGAALREAAEAFRPFRAYAVLHLWRSASAVAAPLASKPRKSTPSQLHSAEARP